MYIYIYILNKTVVQQNKKVTSSKRIISLLFMLFYFVGSTLVVPNQLKQTSAKLGGHSIDFC